MEISKNIHSQLAKRLQEGENPEEIYGEIEEYCNQCKPSNPMNCVELCEIWKLKGKFQEHLKGGWRGNLSLDIVNPIKNDKRIKILEILSTQSYNLEELQQKLKEKGYCHSRSTIHHYCEPLTRLRLVNEEGNLYKLTEGGRRAYEVLAKGGFQELPRNSKGYEEAVLKMLRDRVGTYDELSRVVPRKVLPRVLKRLKVRRLIVRNSPSDRVFFFAAKRRPTRRLSPTELRVFHALPKNGISVRELNRKVGINVRRTYKYLRRLRFKRHALRYRRNATFAITPKGLQLVEALDTVSNIIQN